MTTVLRERLNDPFLSLAADVLDDSEHTRIANENRLRQLTRGTTDEVPEGEQQGLGLSKTDPDVLALSKIVDALAEVEKSATSNLVTMVRRHPLAPWVKAQRGVGDKQAARLLASIGDPYWHTILDQPRTVGQLWAYCGLAVKDGSAIRRVKGSKSNWSANAKMRAYLVAESCSKQLTKPCKDAGGHLAGCKCGEFRIVYDQRKRHTEGRLHKAACVRCGPAGKPAQPGSVWSDGHRHADALRIVSKAILKGLWLEAKGIHEDSK